MRRLAVPLAIAAIAALVGFGSARLGAQTPAMPSYPTPLPMPTPIQLQGVQLIVAPAFNLSRLAGLSRYERKQLFPYVPVLGNEAALGSVSALDEYQRTASLYAQRTAESRAVEARSRGMQAVPLRRGR